MILTIGFDNETWGTATWDGEQVVYDGANSEAVRRAVETMSYTDSPSEQDLTEIARRNHGRLWVSVGEDTSETVKSLPPSSLTHRKVLLGYAIKGKGEPCKRGEAASRTGCIPASKKPAQAKPTKTEKKPTVEKPDKEKIKQDKEAEKKRKTEEKEAEKKRKAEEKEKAKREKQEAAEKKKQEEIQAKEKVKQDAVSAVRELSANPKSINAAQVTKIADGLLLLKLDELKALRSELNLKGGVTKGKIIDSIRDKILNSVAKEVTAKKKGKQPKETLGQRQKRIMEEAKKAAAIQSERNKDELREIIRASGKETHHIDTKAIRKIADQMLLQDFQSVILEFAADDGEVQQHGMSSQEKMKEFVVDGIPFLYGPGAERGVTNTIFFRATDPRYDVLPERLTSASKSLIFTTGRNKDDEYWEEQYKIKNFKSAATGGNGNIVVYNNNYLDVGVYAHESGHNMAVKIWGSVSPPSRSAYADAQAKEMPVTKYGEASSAEDFAEACKYYAQDKEAFKQKFPLKFAALDAMFSDDPEIRATADRRPLTEEEKRKQEEYEEEWRKHKEREKLREQQEAEWKRQAEELEEARRKAEQKSKRQGFFSKLFGE